MIGSGNGNCK